jgi:hypothetical protein
VTSDKYPQQLQRMPERLVSRFGSGLVADIQVPQLETRVAIVRKKAALEDRKGRSSGSLPRRRSPAAPSTPTSSAGRWRSSRPAARK